MSLPAYLLNKESYIIVYIRFIFLFLVLSSCSEQRNRAIEEAPLISIQLKDENGKEILFKDAPGRIVSLAPSLTEMMYALGESDRLIAVSQACDYPDAAQLKLQVSTFPELDRETILGLEPECILATSEIFSPAQVQWFRNQGIPVIFQQYPDLQSVWSGMEQLGVLCGNSDYAHSVCDSFRNVTERIRKSPRTSFNLALLVNSAPLMIVGKESYLNDLIEIAGGKNIGSAFNRSYVEIDVEFLLQKNPDFLLIPAKDDQEALLFLQHYPQLSQLAAVQGKRIFRIEPSVYLRPGPRIIEALQEVQSILRPGGSIE